MDSKKGTGGRLRQGYTIAPLSRAGSSLLRPPSPVQQPKSARERSFQPTATRGHGPKLSAWASASAVGASTSESLVSAVSRAHGESGTRHHERSGVSESKAATAGLPRGHLAFSASQTDSKRSSHPYDGHKGNATGSHPVSGAAVVVPAHRLAPKLHSEKVLNDLERELAAVRSTGRARDLSVATVHGGAAASASAAMSACRRALSAAAAALPSWKPLFARVQAVYDASSARLESLTAALPQMTARSSQLEAAYRREEQATVTMADDRIRRANQRAALAEERAGELEQLLATSRAEAARLQEAVGTAERVQVSLKESNETLVAAYRRCESSTADAERRSAEAATEVTLVRRGADALADELQSLKQQVRTLNRRIKTMVSKLDHQHVQRQLQAARQELADRGHTMHGRTSISGNRGYVSGHVAGNGEDGGVGSSSSSPASALGDQSPKVPRASLSFSLSPQPPSAVAANAVGSQVGSPSPGRSSPGTGSDSESLTLKPPPILRPSAAVAPDGSGRKIPPRLQVPPSPSAASHSMAVSTNATSAVGGAFESFSPLRKPLPPPGPPGSQQQQVDGLFLQLCQLLGLEPSKEASLMSTLSAVKEPAADGKASRTQSPVRLNGEALRVLCAAASRLSVMASTLSPRSGFAGAGPRTSRAANTPGSHTTKGVRGKRFALGGAASSAAEDAATAASAAAIREAGNEATRSAALASLEPAAAWVSSSDPLFRRGVAPLPPTHFTLRPRFLMARGASDDVPRFLRSNGLVRAHDLSKQDTERLIKACWSAKGKQEATLRRQRGDDTLRVSMQDFFWDWLRVTFGGPGQAVEWGSSVVAALQKYAYDADVDVFLRCLQGRLPEDVYTQGNLLVERLEEGLKQRDRAMSGGQTTGFLTVDDIRLHSRETFPHKSPAAMTAVLAALAIDPAVQAAAGGGMGRARAEHDTEAAAASMSGTERVDYMRLLAENAVGDQGPFVETLRAQLTSDFLGFAGDLSSALARVATGPLEDRLITVVTALESIRGEDPAKPEQEVRALVARGLGLHMSELDPESKRPMHLRPFLTRLRSGWLERSGPAPTTRRSGAR